ncbi:MAG: hypothetical protein JST92_23240 [Deltaproteobacteria bacterium]|nr:hypothetical protein [Deltaproteobacteria bacterium]
MSQDVHKKNPVLGAAVVKTVLQRSGKNPASLALYEGLLRDLNLTDGEVEKYLVDHQAEVNEAIKSHGRR